MISAVRVPRLGPAIELSFGLAIVIRVRLAGQDESLEFASLAFDGFAKRLHRASLWRLAMRLARLVDGAISTDPREDYLVTRENLSGSSEIPMLLWDTVADDEVRLDREHEGPLALAIDQHRLAPSSMRISAGYATTPRSKSPATTFRANTCATVSPVTSSPRLRR